MPDETAQSPQTQTGGQPQQSQGTKPPKQSNKTLIIVIIIIVLIGILAAAGYYLQQQFTNDTGSGTSITQDGETVTIQTDQGNVTIGETDLPTGFPDDITVYPDSRVIGSTDTEQGVSVVLETSDSVSKTSDFYKSDLEKNGWNITTNSNVGGSTSYAAEKDDRTVFIASAPVEGDKTNISITVTNQ